MLSEILFVLQNFAISYGNANRKKGSARTQPLKPRDQFQPDYVRDAKERNKRARENRDLISAEEFREMAKSIDEMIK